MRLFNILLSDRGAIGYIGCMKVYLIHFVLIAMLLACPFTCMQSQVLSGKTVSGQNVLAEQGGCCCCHPVPGSTPEAPPGSPNGSSCDCLGCLCDGATVMNSSVGVDDLADVARTPEWTLALSSATGSMAIDTDGEPYPCSHKPGSCAVSAHAVLQTWLL